MLSTSSRHLLSLVFSTVLLLGVGRTASACQCEPRPTVLDAFDTSDEVVIVKVISVEKTATMLVENVFKGKLKVRDQIVFGQGGGPDCVWTFSEESIGNEYLFYLKRPEKFSAHEYLPPHERGWWFAFRCGRSAELAAAADDLHYLRNIGKVRGRTRISGTIGGGCYDPDLNVEGKKVKIIGPTKTYETTTDEDGVFEIYDLPPGKYFVEPEVPAGWKIDSRFRYSPSVIRNDYFQPEMKSSRQVAVKLEPKKHAGVDIVFITENFVRGRVVDPKGRPLARICVSLLAPDETGFGLSDCTDEQGRFEISSIPRDEYVLVANKDNKVSRQNPYPRIFYPGVSERERATVIRIAPGETIDNLDLVIPKLAEMVVVKGVMLYSDGSPVVEGWLEFKADEPDDKVEGDASNRTDRAGNFTMQILKGLTGELWGEAWLDKGEYKNCRKADELIAKSREESIIVKTNIVKLTTDQDVNGVVLKLPLPRCEKVKP